MEQQQWPLLRIGLTIALIGLIIYGIFTNQTNQLDISRYNKDQPIAANVDNGQFADLTLGKAEAPIKVIEYADYQCPACGHYRSQFEQLVAKYPDQVSLTFRNYILPGHTEARAAAGAALAAARQNKFWPMHAKLFDQAEQWSHQTDQRTALFEQYAQELGLNLEQFRQDLQSPTITQKIKFDMALGNAHQLEATPTVIVNGQKLPPETWSDTTKLEQFIQQQLKSAPHTQP